MASRTISLEVDAHERLKALRRLVPPPPGRAADLLERVKSGTWGKSLDWTRIETAYRSRRRSARRSRRA